MDSQSLEMVKTSIIILNWNGAAMLRQYLPSVVQYSNLPNTEIIVADNGSTDDSLLALRAFPSVRIITLDKNYGFAEGYNRAIQQVNSEYIVLLNSDVEVTANWLQPLLGYMDEHPEVAAVMPKIRSYVHKDEFEHAGAAGGYIDRLIYPYCRGRILTHVDNDQGQFDTIAPVFWTTGACMCTRTAIYKQLGGLDTDFFAHMEEIDLCWRMQCRGYKLYCVPQSVVYHLGGGALHYESPRKTYLNFRNCLLMIYKNMPRRHLFLVYALRLVLDYLAALHLLVSRQPKNAWAVVQARIDFWRMRSQYADKRHDNLKKAIVPYPETIAQRSIIFDYYFRGLRQ